MMRQTPPGVRFPSRASLPHSCACQHLTPHDADQPAIKGHVMALPLTAPSISTFSVALPGEHATQRLAIDIANSLERGDLVTLSGDLGAGKTTFARALIRYLAGDALVEVPIPSFTLMQIYDLPQFPLVHADLYRLSGSADLAELG